MSHYSDCPAFGDPRAACECYRPGFQAEAAIENPWIESNGHTWTFDGVCLTCGIARQDNPPLCAT